MIPFKKVKGPEVFKPLEYAKLSARSKERNVVCEGEVEAEFFN